jgi:hypothetical protein
MCVRFWKLLCSYIEKSRSFSANQFASFMWIEGAKSELIVLRSAVIPALSGGRGLMARRRLLEDYLLGRLSLEPTKVDAALPS